MPVAVSPMGGPEGLWSGNQPQFPDIGGYGNHEYGNRVGIFRILAVLDKYGITPTLARDKAVADHYPRSPNPAEFSRSGAARTLVEGDHIGPERGGLGAYHGLSPGSALVVLLQIERHDTKLHRLFSRS